MPFFFEAEDGIRDDLVTGVRTCALPISRGRRSRCGRGDRLGRTAIVGRERGKHGIERTQQLLDFPKPTIAAVHGPVAGMACAWALACGVVVAGADARFHFSFVKVGFVTDCGTSWLLLRRVGIGQANSIVLTGAPEPAEGGASLGLGRELRA